MKNHSRRHGHDVLNVFLASSCDVPSAANDSSSTTWAKSVAAKHLAGALLSMTRQCDKEKNDRLTRCRTPNYELGCLIFQDKTMTTSNQGVLCAARAAISSLPRTSRPTAQLNARSFVRDNFFLCNPKIQMVSVQFTIRLNYRVLFKLSCSLQQDLQY